MRRLFTWLEIPALTLLRLTTGFMFFFHGAQKLLGWFGDNPGPPAFSQIWFAGVIELCGGALVTLGLFTRPVAFLASGTMAVAFFQAHVAGNFADWHWLPIVNRGEMAVLYCFIFLFLAGRGPGPVAADRALGLDR